MKLYFRAVLCLLLMKQGAYAQQDTLKPVTAYNATEKKLLSLSMKKWVWMAEKNITELEPLFHSKSKFVHMSGTWNKDEELEIIKSGSIWYKKAIVHDSAIELWGNTAIVWNRITLEAVVRGSEVKTEFTVTEVYQKKGRNWKLLALTFSSVRDTHQIKK